jgi:RHS repeat-associated protein
MGARKLSYYTEEIKIFKVFSKKETPQNFFRVVRSHYYYYPFGMLLPNTNIDPADGSVIADDNDYRYGFQGQENDPEVKGKGNSVNYKYRMHDPRVGRFFAIDPLAATFPFWSPYAFSGNQVIHSVELEGLETSYNLNFAEGTVTTSGKVITIAQYYLIKEEYKGTILEGGTTNTNDGTHLNVQVKKVYATGRVSYSPAVIVMSADDVYQKCNVEVVTNTMIPGTPNLKTMVPQYDGLNVNYGHGTFDNTGTDKFSADAVWLVGRQEKLQSEHKVTAIHFTVLSMTDKVQEYADAIKNKTGLPVKIIIDPDMNVHKTINEEEVAYDIRAIYEVEVEVPNSSTPDTYEQSRTMTTQETESEPKSPIEAINE